MATSNSAAGPSRFKSALSNQVRPPPKGLKIINKTVDLLKKNAGPKSRGKGKEKEVLGDVIGLVQANKTMPGALQVERFAETRALEILAFQTAIKSAAAQGSSRTFQSLPRHLRRRAASHNPRRVPKRLRSRAAAEIQPTDNIAKIHRKRARLRAKGNLRGESRTEQFAKRQRDKLWLSTHIFHAKRFHMQNHWGYRLPITPTLKSFRPAYRAARRRATVQDVSFFGIIELEGGRADILEVLGRITGGGKFAGDRYESGGRAAQTDFYFPESFPQGLIGPAEIIWQPASASDVRTLWIRLHPSIYNDVWDAIKSVLQRCTAEESFHGFHMSDLRGDVDAFEIIGPMSGKVLKRILRLSKSESSVKAQFYDCLARIEPEEISEGLVAGLRVHDPRLHFPPRVLDLEGASVDFDGVLRAASAPLPSPELAATPLWESSERERLSKPTYKKSDLDRRRQALELPGTRLRPLAKDDRIPIMLIQRSVGPSSNANPESFHGFTLLLPRGWANYFLQSLIFAQAFLIGIAERRVQYREAGLPSFPEQFGGVCKAGKEWERDIGKENLRRWTMKPPGKRAEYSTLGSRSPFVPDWSGILGSHEGDIDIQDEELALNGRPGQSKVIRPWLIASPIIENLQTIVVSQNPPKTLSAIVNIFRKQRSLSNTKVSSIPPNDLFDSALFHVKINMLGRGSPGDMALIYSMDGSQRQEWLSGLEQDGEMGRANSLGEVGVGEIQRLGELRPSQNDLIGYVSSGNFSLSRGKGHVIGMISLKAFVKLHQLSQSCDVAQPGKKIVKLRNRDGVICRLAAVEAVSASF